MINIASLGSLDTFWKEGWGRGEWMGKGERSVEGGQEKEKVWKVKRRG